MPNNFAPGLLAVFLAASAVAPHLLADAAKGTGEPPVQTIARPTTSTLDPRMAEELRVRAGLPNFFAKLAAGGTVRIAYLGGSITAANGWRPKSFAWIQSQFPQAQLIEINAAISGTGSDFGACRITPDVLVQHPDLVFMEHRVNGGGGFEAKSVEGIVRQIWQADPRTDICFIYTLAQNMLPDLQAGKNTAFGTIMETIANTYAIPSIDLGVEIARREQAGTLIFKSAKPVAGKLIFSRDGVHPGDEGHEVYRETIARSMLAMQPAGRPQSHRLPAPLDARCWESTALTPVIRAELSAGWSPVNVATDAIYQEDFARTHGMLRGAVKCDRAGETITLHWQGTTIGFSDIPQGGEMEVEVTMDGGPHPVVLQRLQTESVRHYARFFYLPEHAPGEHTTVLRVKKVPKGLSYYAGQILVIRNPPH